MTDVLLGDFSFPVLPGRPRKQWLLWADGRFVAKEKLARGYKKGKKEEKIACLLRFLWLLVLPRQLDFVS